MSTLKILDPQAWPKLKAVQAERMKRSFKLFVQRGWAHADPAPLVWGKHLDALCACLQAVAEGRIANLLINIPPGHAKSMIVSVLWPAWRWAVKPSWSGMFGSYELGLVTRDAVKTRALMEGDWYTDLFRTDHVSGAILWELQEDQNTKKLYKNTLGGLRQATSVGLGTGYRGDTLVVDDPLSKDGADSDVELLSASKWFFETMPTRFNDMQTAQKVVIMQRLHERDVSGEILSREPGLWQHLNLPAQFNPMKRSVVKDNTGAVVFEDWRTQPGELLFPEKFPLSVINGLRNSLGPYSASGQLDQEPSPLGGGVLKAEWWRWRWLMPGERVREGIDQVCGVPLEGVRVPVPFDFIFSVTDAAFKGTDKSDRVAIGVFGMKWPNLYLLDLVWDQMDFQLTLRAFLTLVKRWPKMSEIIIEEAANGAALISTLKGVLPGVNPIAPEGGKISRILAASPFMSAGNIILPHSPNFTPSPRLGPSGEPVVASINMLIAEASAFPKGRNDDGIDMVSYAVNKFLTNGDGAALAALAAAVTTNPNTGLTIGLPPARPRQADVEAGLAMLGLAKPPGGV